MILKLLELGRIQGLHYHFFASNRVIRALPSAIDAVLDDHHDLDWFYDGIDSFTEAYAESTKLIKPFDYKWKGVASDTSVEGSLHEEIGFTSFPESNSASNYPVSIRFPNLSSPNPLERHTVVALRPYQLAESQSHLSALTKLIEQLKTEGRQLKTLRQL